MWQNFINRLKVGPTRRQWVGVVSHAGLLLLAINLTRADAAMHSHADANTIHVPSGYYLPFFKRDNRALRIPVAEFSVNALPITRAEYLDFVRRNPAWRKSNITGLFAESSYLADWSDDLEPGDDLQSAVSFVSWFAARAFCANRGERLPTVAEWERVAGAALDYAAATTNATFASQTNARLPFRFAMGKQAADLRSSPLQFSDVWEWTQDFNSAPVSGSMESGNNNATRASSSLFCGDGFRSNNAADYGAFLRYSFRSSLHANYALKNLGFRCAH